MTCGQASFTLVTLPVKEYPRLPELPLAGTVDGGVLATAIGQVVPAASRDDTLPVITGVNLEIDEDSIRLVATDRYRLAIRALGWNPAHPGIPRHAARAGQNAVRRRADDDAGHAVRVMMRGGTARRRRGAPTRSRGLAACGRRDDRVRVGRAAADHPADRGEYIKYMSRFPEDFGSHGDIQAMPLVEAVKRVALVAERGSSVRLSFGHGKVTIEAGAEGQARARETVSPISGAKKPRSRSVRTT